MKKIISTALVAMTLSGCGFVDWAKERVIGGEKDSQEIAANRAVLNVGEKKISLAIEIADTPEERQKGLMDREKLDGDAGMLFIFPDSEPRNFWMKNTLIPLDIIFFDLSKKVVSIIDNMEPCKIKNCPFYNSLEPAQYALEVNAGFVDAEDVSLGDTLSW